MKHNSHIIAAVIVTSILIFLTPLFDLIKNNFTTKEWILLPIIVYFGSTMADLDQWNSKIRKYSFLFIFLTIVCFGLLSLKGNIVFIFIGLFGIAIIYSMHRRFYHTPTFGILMAIPLFFINFYLASIFLIAFMTHIITDIMLTRTKRKTTRWLKKHPFIASILAYLGIVKIQRRLKWLEKL